MNMEKYIIGTDCYDEDSYSYTLYRVNNDNTLEILETNTYKDEDYFWDCVDKASKLFNAEFDMKTSLNKIKHDTA